MHSSACVPFHLCVCVCTVGQVKVCLPICRLDSARQLSQTVAAGSCRPICRCCGGVNPLPPSPLTLSPSLSLSQNSLPSLSLSLSLKQCLQRRLVKSIALPPQYHQCISPSLPPPPSPASCPLPPACLTSPTPVALHAALPWPPCAADLK